MSVFEEPPKQSPCMCPECSQGVMQASKYQEIGDAWLIQQDCTHCENSEAAIGRYNTAHLVGEYVLDSFTHEDLLKEVAKAKIGGDVPTQIEDLQECPNCNEPFVFPEDWISVSSSHWMMKLRCANCEWNDLDVWGQETAEAFDVKLDEAKDAAIKELRERTQQNMETEADRLATAFQNMDLDVDDIISWRKDPGADLEY